MVEQLYELVKFALGEVSTFSLGNSFFTDLCEIKAPELDTPVSIIEHPNMNKLNVETIIFCFFILHPSSK